MSRRTSRSVTGAAAEFQQPEGQPPVMESWFSTVRAKRDYIQVFHEQRRRHSTLGQISPRSSNDDRLSQRS